MPQPRHRPDVAAELRPYVDRVDVDAVNAVAERLIEARGIPRAGFRAELNARLADLESKGGRGWRPRHVGAAIAAFIGAGLALLAIAALGVAGAGPLGY